MAYDGAEILSIFRWLLWKRILFILGILRTSNFSIMSHWSFNLSSVFSTSDHIHLPDMTCTAPHSNLPCTPALSKPVPASVTAKYHYPSITRCGINLFYISTMCPWHLQILAFSILTILSNLQSQRHGLIRNFVKDSIQIRETVKGRYPGKYHWAKMVATRFSVSEVLEDKEARGWWRF